MVVVVKSSAACPLLGRDARCPFNDRADIDRRLRDQPPNRQGPGGRLPDGTTISTSSRHNLHEALAGHILQVANHDPVFPRRQVVDRKGPIRIDREIRVDFPLLRLIYPPPFAQIVIQLRRIVPAFHSHRTCPHHLANRCATMRPIYAVAYSSNPPSMQSPPAPPRAPSPDPPRRRSARGLSRFHLHISPLRVFRNLWIRFQRQPLFPGGTQEKHNAHSPICLSIRLNVHQVFPRVVFPRESAIPEHSPPLGRPPLRFPQYVPMAATPDPFPLQSSSNSPAFISTIRSHKHRIRRIRLADDIFPIRIRQHRRRHLQIAQNLPLTATGDTSHSASSPHTPSPARSASHPHHERFLHRLIGFFGVTSITSSVGLYERITSLQHPPPHRR